MFVSSLAGWLAVWSTVFLLARSPVQGAPIYGNEGSPAWLPCPIRSGDVTWYKMSTSGEALAPAEDRHVQALSNNTLHIPYVELSAEGVYVCVAAVGQNGTVEFRVQVRPRWLSVLGLPRQIRVGDTIKLTCAVGRIRPLPSDIYWKFTDSDGTSMAGRKQTTLLDPEYQVYSVDVTISLTLTSADLMRSLKCVLKTEDNQTIRKFLTISSCYGNFSRIPNTASLGGDLAPDRYNTESLCRQYCESMTTCAAFDFNLCNRRCYTNNADYLSHAVHYTVGTVQYRRTSCEKFIGYQTDGAHTSVVDRLVGTTPAPMASLEFSVQETQLTEGEVFFAECRNAVTFPPPEAVFMQFQDQPLDILLSETRRVAVESLPQSGMRLTAKLNYTVSRHDDGRVIRCVLLSDGQVRVSQAYKLRVCYNGYLETETSRSPGGVAFMNDVSHSDICGRACEADESCTAVEYDYCSKKCFKHSSSRQLTLHTGIFETRLYKKSTCLPAADMGRTGAVSDGSESEYPKFLAFAAICVLLLVVVVILGILAIRWYRKYKYSPPVRIPRSRSSISSNGYPTARSQRTSRESKPNRLSMYADPLYRYSSGFIARPPEEPEELVVANHQQRDSNLHNSNRHSAIF